MFNLTRLTVSTVTITINQQDQFQEEPYKFVEDSFENFYRFFCTNLIVEPLIHGYNLRIHQIPLNYRSVAFPVLP